MKSTDRPGPGKFEGNESLAVSEELYRIVNEGFTDQEVGDVSTYGIWYGLIKKPSDSWVSGGQTHLDDTTYIVSEDEQGFFGYTAYASSDEAAHDWLHLSHSFEAVDKIIANETEN
jgi:hypothetical protein